MGENIGFPRLIDNSIYHFKINNNNSGSTKQKPMLVVQIFQTLAAQFDQMNGLDRNFNFERRYVGSSHSFFLSLSRVNVCVCVFFIVVVVVYTIFDILIVRIPLVSFSLIFALFYFFFSFFDFLLFSIQLKIEMLSTWLNTSVIRRSYSLKMGRVFQIIGLNCQHSVFRD